jgi:MFS family permease
MFWSLATSLAGLAENLVQLVALRSLVGVGEAAYTTITPAVLSDFYPYKERNIVFGIYYLAIPIGGALGFAVGAVLGSAYGWRTAFLACGAPGLIIALMVLTIDNPPRGINDRQHPTATTSITAAASESKEGARYGEISQSNKGLTASTKGLLRSPEEDEDITDVTLERYEEGKAQSTADHQGVSSYSHSRQSQQRSGNEDKTPDDGTPLDYSEGEFEAVGLVGNTSRSSVRKEEMSSQRIAVESSSSGSSSTKPLVNDASSRNKTGSLSSSKTGGIITGPGEWRYQSMSHYYGILHSEYHSLISELRVILGNRHYLFAVLGLSATTFAVGGVGEWYATFLIRYCSASINAAGLVVGAASIVGGICGTILGVKTADYFQPRVKSAYFLVSALFCIPCALFLLISINYTDNFGVSVFFLFLAQVCVWTNGGPINTISGINYFY